MLNILWTLAETGMSDYISEMVQDRDSCSGRLGLIEIVFVCGLLSGPDIAFETR